MNYKSYLVRTVSALAGMDDTKVCADSGRANMIAQNASVMTRHEVMVLGILKSHGSEQYTIVSIYRSGTLIYSDNALTMDY
jgi:hypothetical protein